MTGSRVRGLILVYLLSLLVAATIEMWNSRAEVMKFVGLPTPVPEEVRVAATATAAEVAAVATARRSDEIRKETSRSEATLAVMRLQADAAKRRDEERRKTEQAALDRKHSPEAVYRNDFEGLVGSEWSSSATSTTPAGRRRFLGELNNGTVSLTLNSLPAHSKVTLDFDLFIIQSWDGNGIVCCGPDVWQLAVAGGPTLLHTTFAIPYNQPQAYPGTYPGGNSPPRTGAAENNTLGYQNTGSNAPYTGDSVYHLRYTFPHAESGVTFNFTATGLTQTPPNPPSAYDEGWGLDNVVVSVSP